jgi:hypothetical protein
MDVEFHNQEWEGMRQHHTLQATENMFVSLMLRTALQCRTAERIVVGKSAVLNVTRYKPTDIDQIGHNWYSER